MSDEPMSAANRYLAQTARTGPASGLPTSKALPPQPKPKKPRPGKNFRIRVEPDRKRREQVVTKLTTTTESLTAAERQIIRGYRLSTEGPAAEAERRQIEKEARRR